MNDLEFKGTKGEWELGGNTVDGILISARHPQNRDICTVWKYDHSFLEKQEAQANAKLIAAAPELLEALQNILIAIDSEKVILAEEYEMGVKAIEKALK